MCLYIHRSHHRVGEFWDYSIGNYLLFIFSELCLGWVIELYAE